MPKEFTLSDQPFVPGELIQNSDILFIGQSPGADEVREGRPFVGKDGKFFREYLEELDRKKVKYSITNAVKYYTPDNRKPSTFEVSFCLDSLLEDIEYTAPKLIVVLGDTALSALSMLAGGKSIKGIGDLNGKILEEFTIPVLVCYHPSWAIRPTGSKEKFEKGLLPALKYFDREKPVKYIPVKDPSALPTGLCALDIETTGLRPCGVDFVGHGKAKRRQEHEGRIKCIGIAGDKIYYIGIEDE